MHDFRVGASLAAVRVLWGKLSACGGLHPASSSGASQVKFLSILALSAVASSLYAAAPPFNCAANPLAALSGPYVFSIQGTWPTVSRAIIPFNGNDYGITGRFVASIATNSLGAPAGILNVVATSIQAGFTTNGPVTRLETDIGRYQINANCTGGTIWFNLSSRPISFDFWFFDSREQLYLVSNIDGQPMAGRALIAPPGCPAGITSPLQVLTGNYSFKANSLLGGRYYIAGSFTPSIGLDRANQPLGLLAITATSNIDTSATRLESDTGRYTVYPDCSGGQFTYNLSSRPVQYDFWFVFGFDQLYFISTSGISAIGRAAR